MKARISIPKVDPEAYKALAVLSNYIENSSLTKTHKELIKIRASQINGCAYCIDMHTKDARKAGETEQRIYALNAWRETPFFTEEERAILALTEEVTLIQNHVSDKTYEAAANILDEHYLAQVIMAIINICAWNRVGIATGMQPGL
ncbi:alkylhydroperoxidase AhpD family core domain-containing protein [Mucilaginibacter sp. OK268]|jgi:AhpD family alkylhydroperoxidase|uniref:carboxymuconolactone decarboxylase family protein n=1 Tax=Mucilaginibacter sp. OK268 TaxID=1881048 RepID=UPI00088E7519|nr:carboxymuconolactone decarboxylase family protein [Mucilaginibacter sp. OK268]SDP74661.1 alkylhydroperoxidase AhpD family core domain-containing protein [Mucilaginibacter sp. OK268]